MRLLQPSPLAPLPRLLCARPHPSRLGGATGPPASFCPTGCIAVVRCDEFLCAANVFWGLLSGDRASSRIGRSDSHSRCAAALPPLRSDSQLPPPNEEHVHRWFRFVSAHTVTSPLTVPARSNSATLFLPCTHRPFSLCWSPADALPILAARTRGSGCTCRRVARGRHHRREFGSRIAALGAALFRC